MKINITNVNKDALFQKLCSRVVAHHQMPSNRETTSVFFKTITTLTNVFNDPKTVEIDTQTFNDIYGSGVFEQCVEELRKESLAASDKGDIKRTLESTVIKKADSKENSSAPAIVTAFAQSSAATFDKGEVKRKGESKETQDNNAQAIEEINKLKNALEKEAIPFLKTRYNQVIKFNHDYDAKPMGQAWAYENWTPDRVEGRRIILADYPGLIKTRQKLADVLKEMLATQPIVVSAEHEKVLTAFINENMNSEDKNRKIQAQTVKNTLDKLMALTLPTVDTLTALTSHSQPAIG